MEEQFDNPNNMSSEDFMHKPVSIDTPPLAEGLNPRDPSPPSDPNPGSSPRREYGDDLVMLRNDVSRNLDRMDAMTAPNAPKPSSQMTFLEANDEVRRLERIPDPQRAADETRRLQEAKQRRKDLQNELDTSGDLDDLKELIKIQRQQIRDLQDAAAQGVDITTMRIQTLQALTQEQVNAAARVGPEDPTTYGVYYGVRAHWYRNNIGTVADQIRKIQSRVPQQPPNPNDPINLLIDAMRGIPPAVQRDRYADVMLQNELFTRFQPGTEPKFYQDMVGNEKIKYDALMQIARASYVKRVTSNHPEEFGSDKNDDLKNLTIEQAEILYKMPGARIMMEQYARLQVYGRITLPNGTRIDLNQIVDGTSLRAAREELGRYVAQREGLTETQRKEADVAAWGFTYCSLLAESCNSRFFRYDNQSRNIRLEHLPGDIVAQEFWAIMHPQEDFERRCSSGQRWGYLGQWGVEQVIRIKNKLKFDDTKDVILYEDAPNKNSYWEAERTGQQIQVIDKKQSKSKNEIVINSPDFLPPITIGSFLEETKVNGHTLLELLVDGDEIDWQKVGEGPFGGWVAKIDAAYKLIDYYKDMGRKMLAAGKDHGGIRDWVTGYKDIFERRLDIPGRLKKLFGEREAKRRYHNVQFGVILAQIGGVRDINSKKANPNFVGSRFYNPQKKQLQLVLGHENVRFWPRTTMGLGYQEIEPK
jgi:hypothetical protein